MEVNAIIKLHFLEVADPVTGFGIRAGFTYNGKRYLSIVTSQSGALFVRSGAACAHDLTRHQLSEAQIAAVEAFTASGDFAVEYAATIQ